MILFKGQIPYKANVCNVCLIHTRALIITLCQSNHQERPLASFAFFSTDTVYAHKNM